MTHSDLRKKLLDRAKVIGQNYDSAMTIHDQAQADAFFEKCDDRAMAAAPGQTRFAAMIVEKANLGYFAGYYDDETRARVERLFRCAHPFFGAIASCGPPTVEEALAVGIRFGQESLLDN